MTYNRVLFIKKYWLTDIIEIICCLSWPYSKLHVSTSNCECRHVQHKLQLLISYTIPSKILSFICVILLLIPLYVYKLSTNSSTHQHIIVKVHLLFPICYVCNDACCKSVKLFCQNISLYPWTYKMKVFQLSVV